VNTSPGDLDESHWRQGDYTTDAGVFWYVKRYDVDPDGDIDVVGGGERVIGLVVLTQTCDLVRSVDVRPFVLVAPLVERTGADALFAQNGHVPQFAWVPGAGPTAFADLDRAVCYDKEFLRGLEWHLGVRDSEEATRFGESVGRKFARYAFPDEFHRTVSPLVERVKEKHGSSTKAEGEFFAKVRQIRVEADWTVDAIEATLIFVLDPSELPPVPDGEVLEPSPDLVRWYGQGRRPDQLASKLAETTDDAGRLYLWGRLVEAWVDTCKPEPPIVGVSAEVLTSDDVTLTRYWGTQRLDLDYLSGVHDPGDK
jgi:hypothetical protein